MLNSSTPWHHPKRWGSAVVVWALMAQMVVPAHAFVSQLPGVYTTPPDVNVMFTLDDSGSMYSEAIPDYGSAVVGLQNGNASAALPGLGGGNGNGTMFPALWYERKSLAGVVAASSAYFSTTYYLSTNAYARFLRSSASNPLYYDPAQRYSPWPTAADDSVLHPAADPTRVNVSPANPFDTTCNAANTNCTINLTTRRVAIAPDLNETTGFWPATYFKYKGPAPLTTAEMSGTGNNLVTNFDKVEIKSAALTPTFTRNTATLPDGTVVVDDGRTDCAAALTCTYAEEIQNFANWLQYYHSRMLMAKGGVAAAFARQGTNMRVGFGTINTAGVVRRGVAQFSGANRTAFYNEMYPRVNAGGTPLRQAMDQVGQYFQRSNVGNPWAEDPTSGVIGTEYACRRSFHILSTDGFWNGNAANATIDNINADNFTGLKTPLKPGATVGEDYSDTSGPFGINPFGDTANHTLADVAAYYWREDLRPDAAMPNKVVPSKRDPAFWQHLTTYTIGLGITGTGGVARTSDGSTRISATLPASDPLYDYRGEPWLQSQFVRDWLINNKVPMTWTAVAADSQQTGDDLVHSSMNGRGRYFSATNPTDLATGLASALAEVADQPLDFASLAVDSLRVRSGGKAFQATFNPSGWFGRLYAFTQSATGIVTNTPSTATYTNPDQVWEASNKMPLPANRNIFTSSGTAATVTPFLWSNLTTSQKTNLGNDSTLLDFLRGDASNELANGGTFRDRSRYTVAGVTGGVLGDIVGSTPLKGPDAGGAYDKLPTADPGQSTYSTFRLTTANLADMRNTMFLGANDGMLHAFNLTDGVERFAYVPSTVYNVPRSTSGGLAEQKLRMLADPGYTHRFTVDGAPNIADAYFGSDWHSLLVGSTGAGARGIFAMDVTKTVVGSGGFDASKILWELNESTNTDMGFVLAYPHVARMRNGKWAVISGNGYDSASGRAVLLIREAATGAVIKDIPVGVVGSNGLSQPNFILNANREVIAIYAGDLKGSLWKFDVSSTTESVWASAFGSTTPLFTAMGPSGNVQPIAVMPEISPHPNGNAIITFGTGKLFDSTDSVSSTTSNVNLTTQSIYGIWDKPGETTGVAITTGTRATVLKAQGLKAATGADPTNFRGSTTGDPNWATQRGWFLDLATTGERSNLPPQQFQKVLVVVANTPAIADPCASGGQSKIFVLNPVTGAAPTFAVFDTNAVTGFDDGDAGWNVLVNTSSMLTQPVFQIPPDGAGSTTGGSGSTGVGGSVSDTAPTLRPEDPFYRGQVTGARQGGVDLSDPEGPCGALMSAPQSNTVLLQLLFNGCLKKPRVSWRQLK